MIKVNILCMKQVDTEICHVISCYFIAVRKRSCGQVMFSQACVKNSVHRRGSASVHAGIHSPGKAPPGGRPYPPAEGYSSGRYVSYWNAFLFQSFIMVSVKYYTMKSEENRVLKRTLESNGFILS